MFVEDLVPLVGIVSGIICWAITMIYIVRRDKK